MPKFIFYAGIGFANANQREEIEIPDSELEGLSEEERNNYIEECYQDWLTNHQDNAWWEVGKEEGG